MLPETEKYLTATQNRAFKIDDTLRTGL